MIENNSKQRLLLNRSLAGGDRCGLRGGGGERSIPFHTPDTIVSVVANGHGHVPFDIDLRFSSRTEPLLDA